VRFSNINKRYKQNIRGILSPDSNEGFNQVGANAMFRTIDPSETPEGEYGQRTIKNPIVAVS
jgi:hypothetical protein